MSKLPAARILSREEIFRRFRRVDSLQIEPRSLRHDGFAPVMEREVVISRACSAVLPYVAETDEVLLLRQFRVGALVAGEQDPFLVECVAGFLDDGETPEDAARRETLEETGAEILDLESFGHYYPSAGGSSERVHMFVARIRPPKAGVFGVDDEAEEIVTTLHKFDDAMRMLDNGEIRNGIGALSLNWFARHRDRLRRKWLPA